MTDTQLLDWLEEYINTEGAIALHDGDHPVKGHAGIGLRPGSLSRTLREAIRQAAGPVPGPPQPPRTNEHPVA